MASMGQGQNTPPAGWKGGSKWAFRRLLINFNVILAKQLFICLANYPSQRLPYASEANAQKLQKAFDCGKCKNM
jgi:hypothetical protein